MSIAIDANHKIPGAWYKASPNVSGPLVSPTLIVLHYTAGGAGAADWLCRPEAQASAHVVIERDGTIRQIVPFNVRAWHAGASHWKGRSGCNAFSIGIEIANWGPVTKRADGTFVNWAGGRMNAHVLTGPLRHKNGGLPQWWEVFPEVQLRVVENLVRALIERYPSITDIAGHDDVAPQNKIDPGPAFPMRRFQQLLPAASRMADASTPVPPGYTRTDDGNVIRENVEDSGILKDAGAGQNSNWVQTFLGGGGLVSAGGLLSSMNGIPGWVILGLVAIGAAVVIAGIRTDWKFRSVKKRRRKMHVDGVA